MLDIHLYTKALEEHRRRKFLRQDEIAHERNVLAQEVAQLPCVQNQRGPITPQHCYGIVMSVDGSQLYPDRHEGSTLYLLQAAVTHFAYSHEHARYLVKRSVQLHDAVTVVPGMVVSAQYINIQRALFEIELFIEYWLQYKANEQEPQEIPLLFLDGSLVLWGASDMQGDHVAHLIECYHTQMQKLISLGIPYLGYISAPSTRELIERTMQSVDAHSSDALILSLGVLRDRCWTVPQLYRVGAHLVHAGDASVYGCYYNTGTEIARIEMPKMIACNEELLLWCLARVADQISKGKGYPIALTYAHYEAVVTHADREYFYTTLREGAHVPLRSAKLQAKHESFI